MKVENMRSPSGKKVLNQFIVTVEGKDEIGNLFIREIFVSYETTIAVKTQWENRIEISLDPKYWNYSVTTSKYRTLFLGEKTKETQRKIDSGEYKLQDLNI